MMPVACQERNPAMALSFWLVVSAFGALLSPPAIGQNTDMAVIVNSNNAVTNLSLVDLRKILAGQKRSWPGGAPVKIMVRGAGSRERIALLRLLGMSEAEYKQYWTAQVFRGEADSEPPVLPSFGMVKEAMKAFPGAIALADSRELKPGMDLKVIRVDGHLPGEDGYPVR